MMNSIKELTIKNWELVDQFCRENPSYFVLQSGEGGEIGGAEDIFKSLPAGRSLDNKFIYGFFQDDQLTGLAEGIRHYPQKDTWMIGLFIIAERMRNQSVGTVNLKLLESTLKEAGAKGYRIGVLDVNPSGMRFWKRQGYIPTGEVKTITFENQIQRVHILEKRLQK